MKYENPKVPESLPFGNSYELGKILIARALALEILDSKERETLENFWQATRNYAVKQQISPDKLNDPEVNAQIMQAGLDEVPDAEPALNKFYFLMKRFYQAGGNE